MHARKRPRLVITGDAEIDLEDALFYTEEQWGANQRRLYQTRIYDAMRLLREFPELGQPRDEYFSGCRSLAVERHIVYYRVADEEIITGRVLHGNQEATGKVRF